MHHLTVHTIHIAMRSPPGLVILIVGMPLAIVMYLVAMRVPAMLRVGNSQCPCQQ